MGSHTKRGGTGHRAHYFYRGGTHVDIHFKISTLLLPFGNPLGVLTLTPYPLQRLLPCYTPSVIRARELVAYKEGGGL